ncbi:IclR family transcriptional regulator domain-containing protein [Marisediminicola senii]|uniref:IclR family transcriptional regulator domain-containing protein n=1 Tax=Marisediminicola senii TaxID=2711233 RepID=UPI00191211A6|nr:IclR family transcriptional regulator C-terminal domain-containing protein [Marisediminicola senii]
MVKVREIENPDFIEAIARGVDVLKAFGPGKPRMTLSEVAAASSLARPTARRILITFTELGYVRADDGGFTLTPRVLELGMAYIASSNIWELSQPHLQDLSERVGESCSIAQLDGSDIVYVARVAVPKLVAFSVSIGTRFPAVATSLGKVLLAALTADELDAVLATESRSVARAVWSPDRAEIDETLREVRERGWAMTDQQLAPSIRSVAAPVRGADGTVVAAVNVNTHAFETSLETLVDEYLPQLLRTATDIGEDWARWDSLPTKAIRP